MALSKELTLKNKAMSVVAQTLLKAKPTEDSDSSDSGSSYSGSSDSGSSDSGSSYSDESDSDESVEDVMAKRVSSLCLPRNLEQELTERVHQQIRLYSSLERLDIDFEKGVHHTHYLPTGQIHSGETFLNLVRDGEIPIRNRFKLVDSIVKRERSCCDEIDLEKIKKRAVAWDDLELLSAFEMENSEERMNKIFEEGFAFYIKLCIFWEADYLLNRLPEDRKLACIRKGERRLHDRYYTFMHSSEDPVKNYIFCKIYDKTLSYLAWKKIEVTGGR